MPSPARSARVSANTSPERSRTGPPWPSRRTWRGCWLPTPATACPASRWRGTFHPFWPSARRWRRHSGSASRASAGNVSSVRTPVQTLFYGVFSAWVLWSRAEQKKNGPLFEGHYDPQRFRWREAVWHLRAPVLRALFQQLADPSRLKLLGLVEVLNWTSAALDRVDRTAFFSRFNEGEAVPYFYEPFLEAFDPVLRKQLGVWYTPTEVVRYMVARVDRALKGDLGIPAGLAAENVYVLDPCCGTGAYLAEVLPPRPPAISGSRGSGRSRARRSGGRRPSVYSGSRSCPRRSWWRICRSASPCRIWARRWRRTGRSARECFSPTRLRAGSRTRPSRCRSRSSRRSTTWRKR